MGPNSSTLDPSHVDLGSISTSLMGKISVKQNSWTQSSPTVSSASLRKCAVNLIKFPQSSSGRSELTKTLIIQKVTSQGFRLHEKSATSKSTYISKRSKQHKQFTKSQKRRPKAIFLGIAGNPPYFKRQNSAARTWRQTLEGPHGTSSRRTFTYLYGSHYKWPHLFVNFPENQLKVDQNFRSD